MSHKKRIIPHPVLSLLMLITWMVLNSFSPGHFLLGTFLALLIPYLVQDFWPNAVKVHKPLHLIWYIIKVTGDIMVANFVVAKQILGPSDKLNAAFFDIPLEIENDFTISVLAGTISLTPGTVSADLSPDRKRLIVHALNVNDIEAEINLIKQRYEQPLKEIFECYPQ
ncbi:MULTISPECIES: Na+/H+ antiporter subunit E [Gammaproteobacteria]|uniref:Na+/H+ antiporter subunit E n=1 Tax=Gammaproteobacteria TaxID=1236 RepID=UPI000DD081E5|nr:MULTISPECIES: Na+/H+ antiporter subunit E [Gammaproteobacteria]RTE86647.1 Na+/H+ antiporter subunit E [Aliidiomarina sp. B3213]TCZ90798.1 Na+/H+ antiporter subunit E [Lysobacter sp. N42]